MKGFGSVVFFLVLVASSSVSYAQIGNGDGRYNAVIDRAYEVLQYIKDAKKSELKSSFKESGFQKKSEFKHFLSSRNVVWASQLLSSYGMPDKKGISISEWRTSSKDNVGTGMSVNLTFYFRKAGEPFSQTNDNICLNFVRNANGDFLLDGLMFFRKDDYVQVKKIIDQIP